MPMFAEPSAYEVNHIRSILFSRQVCWFMDPGSIDSLILFERDFR